MIVSSGAGSPIATALPCLVEVKLTEAAFSHCNGRTSPNNKRKDVCQSAQLFFDDPQECYLDPSCGKNTGQALLGDIRGKLRQPARRLPERRAERGMPLRLRHAATNAQPGNCTQGLVQEGTVEKAWYVLCSHDHNRDIAGHWQAWQRLVSDATPAPFLSASEVIKVGEEDGLVEWGKYMRARYQL